MKRSTRVLLAILLVLLLVPPAALADAPGLVTDQAVDVSGVLAQSTPSVVGIVVSQPPSKEGDPPVWSTGAGIVYRADGYIVTSAHVVDGALRVQVRLADGTLLQVDPKTDILVDAQADVAVLRLKGQTLQPATFADSATAVLGQPVLALGNPLGFRLAASLSAGVLSGVNRHMGADVPLLQADLVVNPGNSGGPLLTAEGKVLGMIRAQNGTNGLEGMAFALPANELKAAADALILGQHPKDVWLGLVLDEYIFARFGLENRVAYGTGRPIDIGLYVTAVVKGSPADGLVPVGDYLVAINGNPVGTLDDVARLLRNVAPGASVSLMSRTGLEYRSAGVIAIARPADAGFQEEAARNKVASSLLAPQDFAMLNAAKVFGDFAEGYVQGSANAAVFLQTPFMYSAYRSWKVLHYKTAYGGQDLVLTADTHLSKKLAVTYVLRSPDPAQPVATGWTVRLVQEGQEVLASGTSVRIRALIPPLQEMTGDLTKEHPEPLELADRLRSSPQPYYVGNLEFPAEKVKPDKPLTVELRGPKGEVETFTFDYKALR